MRFLKRETKKPHLCTWNDLYVFVHECNERAEGKMNGRGDNVLYRYFIYMLTYPKRFNALFTWIAWDVTRGRAHAQKKMRQFPFFLARHRLSIGKGGLEIDWGETRGWGLRFGKGTQECFGKNRRDFFQSFPGQILFLKIETSMSGADQHSSQFTGCCCCCSSTLLITLFF